MPLERRRLCSQCSCINDPNSEVRPAMNVLWRTDGDYNMPGSSMQTFNTRLTLAPSAVSEWSVEYRFTKDTSSLFSSDVTFFPKAMGRGEAWSPNGIVSAVSPDIPGHPILIGEFTDLQARRYVMIVNNSMTENTHVGLTFPGKDVKVFSWGWDGKEREGGAYSADGESRDANGLTIRHWLAPGQEAVYRVQSEAASNEPMPRG